MHAETVGALQAWYSAQCDGEWEQRYGITIGTLEDAGWQLQVDLVGTPLAGSALERERMARTPDDWLEVWCDGFRFNAVGGVGNLGELLTAFSSFSQIETAL